MAPAKAAEENERAAKRRRSDGGDGCVAGRDETLEAQEAVKAQEAVGPQWVYSCGSTVGPKLWVNDGSTGSCVSCEGFGCNEER
mmetsp:Transcript_13466/g.34515  ORF Transcript_13466/g.34515 Transcript_13466/m.34515 type:complete len:84 (+) Transcript_13466:1033-1284(+)